MFTAKELTILHEALTENMLSDEDFNKDGLANDRKYRILIAKLEAQIDLQRKFDC